MTKAAARNLSNRPDPVRLEELAVLQRWAILAVLAIAGIILCGWIITPVGARLPRGWSLMKPVTALAALMSGLSLSLSQPKRSRRLVLSSRFIAGIVALISAATLLEYFLRSELGIQAFSAAEGMSGALGRMAPQTSIAFLLLGTLIGVVRARKGYVGLIADSWLSCSA